MEEKQKQHLKKVFGDWFNFFETFLESEEYNILLKNLNKIYKTEKVIPSFDSKLLFKIFRDTSPKKVKVVILGQDPYPTLLSNGDCVYDGYAFSNSKSFIHEYSPSLKNIITEISNTIDESSYDEFLFDRGDWTYLVKQGVLPINTALTVRQGEPDSHTTIWRNFTLYWIKKLSKNPNIVWLLFGNKAQYFEKYIENGGVIKVGHPSPLNTKNPFIGSNVFIACNEWLENTNQNPIMW